jgi:outer membrane protein
MKKLLQFVLMLQLCATSTKVNAQLADTIAVTKWTIHDCLEYAAAHNIDVNTLRLNELSSIQDLSAARAVKIPSLNGAVGNTFTNANNDITGNNAFVNQLSSTGTYSLNADIVLWNGNLINNTILQNKLLVQSAGLAVNHSINTITLLIAQAYLNILLSKENLKYVNDLVAASAALVKQGQLFYDAGSVAKINLLQLQSQYAGDKYLLVQTQNAIRENTLLLKQLLQLPTDSLFDIVTPDSVAAIEPLPSLQRVQEKAMQSFPEIKIGQLGIEIASLGIAKARGGFKPVLAANASIGSGYSDMIRNASAPKTGYFTQAGNNFHQRLGITLSIPVFSNRINKTNLAKANIQYTQSTLNLQNYRLVLSQAVEQVYLNVSNAQQAYSAANEQLVAATESFRIINEQFRLGGTSTFEVTQLRNQYVQAVQAYTQTKYTAVLQFKIYEFYLGNPVTF